MIIFKAVLTYFAIAGFFICLHTSAMASEPNQLGQSVFEQRCQSCHDLPDPDNAPTMGWEERLKLMAKVARLTPNEKADVLSYLQSHTKTAVKKVSLEDERRLFEEKCSLCHTLDRIFLEPLDDEARKHIVSRMSGKLSNWISDEEATQVLNYLSRIDKVERIKKTSNVPAEIFQDRCSACHTLERVYKMLQNDKDGSPWLHIVQRMQKKAPQWLSKEDAKLVVEYLKSTQ